jgi:hypothetical protein
VALDAPIAPGEKRVIFSYLLPTGENRVSFPISDSIEVLNLLVEESTADMHGVLDPRRHRTDRGPCFQALDRSGGSRVEGRAGLRLKPGAMAVAGAGGVRGDRVPRRIPHSQAEKRSDPARVALTDPLVDSLARLDARYAGRESDVPAEEWATYVAERARLKRELEAHLAGGGRINLRLPVRQLLTLRAQMLGSRCKSGAAPPL